MITCDALFDGKLILYQEKDGYRFSLDAVLLAGLTQVGVDDRVIDLGAGCGVVPLILAYQGRGGKLAGVEIQRDLAELARRNVEANGFTDRVEILEADMTQIADRFGPESFDLVLSNPPYRRRDSGRMNPNRQRAIARHEVAATVSDVFAAGKYLLPVGGRLAVIYPAARLDHLMVEARRFGFTPKRLTVIYSSIDDPARLVHLECRRGGGEELFIAPAFFIYREDGSYSESMQRLYAGRDSLRAVESKEGD